MKVSATVAVCAATVAMHGSTASPANAAGLQAEAPTGSLASGLPAGGATVSGKRVGWVRRVDGRASPHAVEGYELVPKPLSGARDGHVDLDFRAVTRPAVPAGAVLDVVDDSARWAGDRVVLLGQWALEAANPTTAPKGLSNGFVAVFDARSGQLLGQRTVDVTGASDASSGTLREQFVPGDAPLLRSWQAEKAVLIDAADGHLLSTTARVAEARGASALVYDGPLAGAAPRWSRGRGTVRVVDVETGRVRYRVSARELIHAAGGTSSSPPEIDLQRDGGLAVTMRSRGTAALRAVAVDAKGNVRRLSRPLRGARAVAGATAGPRAFVGLTAQVGTKRHRVVDRLWLTDGSGRRGTRVPLDFGPSSLTRTSFMPFWWDGRTAVWDAESRSGARYGVVTMERTLTRRLTADGAPSGA